jgi:hypothetical protein
MHMKNRFLKSVLVLSTVLALVNCSEETADAINNLDPQANQPTEDNPNTLPADEPCWLLNAGSDFLIYSAGIVTDVNGNVVGTITFIDGTLTGSIVAIDGSVIVENVDASALPLVTRATMNATTTPTTPASSAGTSTTPTLSSATDPTPTLSSGSNPTIPVASSSSEKTAVTSSATNPQVQSSSSNQQQPKSSSATSSNQCDGKCLDSASGKCVDPHTTLKGSHDEQYAYDESCKINCYYDPTNQNCQNMGGSAAPASSTSQPKSSSSVKSSSSQQQQQPKSSSSAKSSSSQQQIKSSSSQATNPNASAEEAKYLNAGAGGQQGFATRYWDCCMPHCAWPEHGGKAKTCDAKGKTPIGNNNGSICSNGQGTTCTSQTPIIVSEKLAYAFAATPGNDNTCGKCFALTFTGQGKYETKANHQALKGKTLVVMASNIGYDVQGGQFDVMIPGGGVGAFNGCANMGWGDQGAQYGGLLSKCEDEVGYDGDLLTKRKQCLTEKCNKSFANDAEAKEGCLFLATWMEAAGNPLHTYKEVDCPQALIQKF